MSMIYTNSLGELVRSIMSPDDNYELRERDVQKIMCRKYSLLIEATKECNVDYDPIRDTIVESRQSHKKSRSISYSCAKITDATNMLSSSSDNMLKKGNPSCCDDFGDIIRSDDQELLTGEKLLRKKRGELTDNQEYYWNNIQEPRVTNIHTSGKCSRFNILVDGIHIATIDPTKIRVHLPDPVETYQTVSMSCKLLCGDVVCVKKHIKLLPFSRFIAKQQCDSMNIPSYTFDTKKYDDKFSSPECGGAKSLIDTVLNTDIRKYKLGTNLNSEIIEGTFLIGFQSEWVSVNICADSTGNSYDTDDIITSIDFSYLIGTQCSSRIAIELDAFILPESFESRTFIPQRCVPMFHEIPPGEFIKYGISHIDDDTSVMAISYIKEDKNCQDKPLGHSFSFFSGITRKTKG